MRMYRVGDDVGALEDWPFDNPDSRYRVLRGAPRASGRLEAGGAGALTRAGIWRCTPGAFRCIEQGDELMTVLAGRCRITDHGRGDAVDLGPGDTLFIRDGSDVTWEVAETVTKVFFGAKATPYR